MFTCDYCNNEYATKSSLNHHKRTAKKCLLLRESTEQVNFLNCKKCGFQTTLKNTLIMHKCKLENINYVFDKKITELEEENKDLKLKLEKSEEDVIRLATDNINLERKIESYEEKFYTLASRPTISTINNTRVDYSDDHSTILIDEDENNDEEDEEYKLLPLEVGQGYTIEHREEDGFINVTNLCKAGGKQFKSWFRLDKTKAFLQVLSVSVLIHTDTLIKYIIVSKTERSTWAHPQVAINIAQWISPNFDVKVSAWVYEVMMTGKVDISNTKSYRQLQSENKDKELKIQYLTKKYVKRQPRVDYQERNVVYILTTGNMKKERRYILGKAENLTNRLSVYNKSDEHEVIYYQECSDEEKMNIVETMVFNKLKEYREQANRERFILPKEKDIEYFKDTIKKVIEFVK